jgi:hypothetical protein
MEADRLGYSYRLRFMNSENSNSITEKRYLQRGDCVAVERGNYADIRRDTPTLCTSNPSTAADRKYLREAGQCHERKEQLLAATTQDEIDVASRKVSITCEY